VKAQFMLVSAVIAGLTLITVGTVITQVQGKSFSPEKTSYDIRYLEDEAERVTSGGPPNRLERYNYRRLVSQLDYSSDVRYRSAGNCFDVNLTSSDERYRLECLPNGP